MRILLVEDEKKVASFIKKGLEEEFYSVDAAYDGKEGLRLALTEEYDLIILDIMLPVKDGFTVLQELRNEKISIPVLFLTAKDTLSDKVQGLDSGADDYLPKPFAFEELLARVRALLRRGTSEKNLTLKALDLSLDTQSHTVTRDNAIVQLTPKEYSILEYLLRNKNRVISRTMLSEHVYDYHFDSDTNVIDVYINKLRNKVDKGFDTPIIHTVRGVGYIIKDK
ncbi:MAG: response regulator transcription factor [Ignavibacteriaceae bacterium]|jgi:heavy metal response regulator|nr:response regulator transcription factor [Ignavibacteriaceae bacterium]MCW8818422.1 response regulator transcription factor [Ignavibacteriaceae bacterium]